MAHKIFTRSFWSFIALTDIFAAIGLYELLVPKDHTMTYIWDVSYDWRAVLVGLACVSVAVAIISLGWPPLRNQRMTSSTAQ